MAEGKGSSVLKWILIGCGSIVLIAVIVMAGCFYFVKKKVDSVKESVNTMTKGAPPEVRGPVVALSVLKPFMGMMVAPGDKPAADKMFADLDAKASKLDTQDGRDLKTAMDAYNDANRQAGSDQAARQAAMRKLVADAQAVLDRH